MTIATKQDIRDKVRRMTGSPRNYPTNAAIDNYIDSFYLYDLPAEFKSLQLEDVLTFTTVRGLQTYAWDANTYSLLNSPILINKTQMAVCFSRADFTASYPSDAYNELLATGDGTTSYTGTLSKTPILRSWLNDPNDEAYPAGRMVNVIISANSSLGTTQTVSDIGGNGPTSTLSDASGANLGTINYSTGAVTVNFPAVVPSGEEIRATYIAQTLAQPIAILWSQNSFIVAPTPDKAYIIEIPVSRRPSSVLQSSSAANPELNEWWELIAAGAAKKVFEDRSDTDGIQLMDKILEERYSIAESRTYLQLTAQRVPTIFSGQTAYNPSRVGSQFWGN